MRRKIRATSVLGLTMAAVMMCSGCQTFVTNSDSSNQTSAADVVQEAVQEGVSEDGIPIVFSDDGITTGASTGVTIEDNVVTITAAGSYELSGTGSDARIVVTVDKEDEVELILNGLDLTCSNYAPIVVTQAGEVTIDLAEGSVNKITDGETYDLTDSEDTTDAAIFSMDDLKLKGDGTLYIYANYNHGIVAKDDLKIKGGTYIIEAVTDGINANDSITIDGGTFYIAAGDDGMHVDEVLTVNVANIVISESTEGLEGHQVIINGGTIDITASDDGINSNSGGEESVSDTDTFDGSEGVTGDMELPDDAQMPQDMSGDMPNAIDESEGMSGNMRNHMDDSEYASWDMNWDEDISEDTAVSGGRGGFGGGMGGAMTMDTDADSLLQINAGSIIINAGGDGLDSNGVLEINGGSIYVSGAANSGNSAIDYGTEALVNGGILIATGYSGMAEQFGTDSEQCSFIYSSSSNIAVGTVITLTDGQGNELVSWEALKECNCIMISTPELTVGESYTLSMGNDSVEVEITDVVNSLGNGVSGMQSGGRGGF